MKRLLSVTAMSLSSILLITGILSCTPTEQVKLNISAGVGLKDAVTDINNLYMVENPEIELINNFSASGAVMQQIENGAPTDIFFTPSTRDMDTLQHDNLIFNDTRKNLLYNKLILIVPADSELVLTGFEDLAGEEVQRIAIGDPKFVPAGTFAQQVFDYFNVADEVKSKLVLASDVRQVLIYTESNNVDAGIVYLTDALTSSGINIIAYAPEHINTRIVFTIAAIKTCKNIDAATDYIDFLSSEKARAVFEKYGFSVTEKTGN